MRKSVRGEELGAKLKRALTTKDTLDQGTLLGELIQAFGGIKPFALKIVELEQSTNSPMVRQKIMQMVVQLMISTTGREMAQEFDPTLLSDEELAIISGAHIERVAKAGDAKDA